MSAKRPVKDGTVPNKHEYESTVRKDGHTNAVQGIFEGRPAMSMMNSIYANCKHGSVSWRTLHFPYIELTLPQNSRAQTQAIRNFRCGCGTEPGAPHVCINDNGIVTVYNNQQRQQCRGRIHRNSLRRPEHDCQAGDAGDTIRPTVKPVTLQHSFLPF